MSQLFEPMTINHLILPNRLVMPPMATAKADEHDGVTDEAINYYLERAKYSKIGLIITEHSYINIQGKAHPGQMSIATDDAISGLKRLTDCIHGEGVKIFAQISHAGSATVSDVTGQPPVGPSAIRHPKNKKEIPHAMTASQIAETTTWFAEAALRAKKAGFDGAEIHAAHGYLLNQFYSPLYNRRTDEYGPQSVENRTRFLFEVIAAVRKYVGDDFPLSVRLGGCDYQEGGSTVDDCVEACRILERSGVDLIHLTGGMNGFIRPGHSEPGYFSDMSVPVKKAVKTPVLLTGGINTIAQAEALIDGHFADMAGVGRAIFKNAHWAD